MRGPGLLRLGPGRAGGPGRSRAGAPKVARERRPPRAKGFTLLEGHALPGTSPPARSRSRAHSPALSGPPSRRQPLSPARLSPSHSFGRPLLQARAPGPHRGSPDSRTPAGRGPRTARPGASGRRERGGGAGAQAEVSAGRAKPEDPLSSCPQPLPPGSNLPASQGPYPNPYRVAEVCNLQPQPAQGKRPVLPGLTSGLRAQVPGSRRLPERRRRTRRAGGRSGNGAAAQERPPALGSATRCSADPRPRPLRSGSSSSGWTRGRPARPRGAGLRQRSPRSN